MLVCTQDGHWVIGNYDDPRIELMSPHERSHVQIRKRETPIECAPVLVKRLSCICSVRASPIVGLDLAQFA